MEHIVKEYEFIPIQEFGIEMPRHSWVLSATRSANKFIIVAIVPNDKTVSMKHFRMLRTGELLPGQPGNYRLIGSFHMGFVTDMDQNIKEIQLTHVFELI